MHRSHLSLGVGARLVVAPQFSRPADRTRIQSSRPNNASVALVRIGAS